MDTMEFGPQYENDSVFAARMRFHQSWYRAHVLRAPWGVGPKPSSRRELGSMLKPEDAALGVNFLTPAIWESVRRRLSEDVGLVEEYRLLHNMLSSQPMCFNLFAPLADDLCLASRVFSTLLPDEVDRVTLVTFEYAPKPASDYLGDRTAFDCYVEYDRKDGRQGFVGIETKLTEPFSQKHYDRPAYRRWVEGPGSPWREDSWGSLADVRHNQLWRDHLLAVAMLVRSGSPYSSGCLMLARHPTDKECDATVEGYQRLIKAEDTTFVDCPLDRIADAMEASPCDGGQRTWIAEFRRRYLDLSLSEKMWRDR